MSAFTDYLESGLLNFIFRQSAFSAPSGLYIGLTKSFNLQNLEIGVLDEPNTGNYSRQLYLSSSSKWIAPYASGMSMATHNTSSIEFPIATQNIGNVSGIFISDSISNGNILFYAQLSSSRNIREGDQFICPSGSLKVIFS
jgi:hypothetical protein